MKQRLSLILLSSALTLLFLEIATRFLLPYPYDEAEGRFYACDSRLGWTGKPHFNGLIEGREYAEVVQFNSLGFHDSDHPKRKPSDSFRILMLGDSFVQAVQVAEAETAHQQLEDLLNHQDFCKTSENRRLSLSKPTSTSSVCVSPDDNSLSPNVEVISGGVINWGTNQQLLFYREQGRHFEPDLVLLMVYLGNDLQDNLPGNGLTAAGFNCYAPYFAVCEDGFNPTPLRYAPGISGLHGNCSMARRGLINSLGWLYQNSRLYQQIEPLISVNTHRQTFGQAYPMPFSALYLEPEEPALTQAWQTTLETLAQLQHEVEADGRTFAVALISPAIVVRLLTLSEAERAQFLQDDSTFANAQADRPNRRLAEFFRQQNTPFIDLTLPLAEYQTSTNTPLYFLHDGHWTVEGHRVAAQQLAYWLSAQALLPID